MRKAKKVSVQRLSREAITNSVTYQLGIKSDLSELENKFIGRGEGLEGS